MTREWARDFNQEPVFRISKPYCAVLECNDQIWVSILKSRLLASILKDYPFRGRSDKHSWENF